MAAQPSVSCLAPSLPFFLNTTFYPGWGTFREQRSFPQCRAVAGQLPRPGFHLLRSASRRQQPPPPTLGPLRGCPHPVLADREVTESPFAVSLWSFLYPRARDWPALSANSRAHSRRQNFPSAPGTWGLNWFNIWPRGLRLGLRCLLPPHLLLLLPQGPSSLH
jgi:hypothetical protein